MIGELFEFLKGSVEYIGTNRADVTRGGKRGVWMFHAGQILSVWEFYYSNNMPAGKPDILLLLPVFV